MEVYDFGKDFTTEQRNELLNAINDQKSAALRLHQIISNVEK